MREIAVDEYDTIVFDGLRISVQLFRFFADDANANRIFKFVAREHDAACIHAYPPGTTVVEPQ